MNTIILVANGRRDEIPSTAVAILPGALIEVTSAGLGQAHSTEGGFAERAVAVEDALQGLTVTDAYAATLNTKIFLYRAVPGDRVQGILTAGVSYTAGTKLISAGDGKLIREADAATTTNVKDIVGVIGEADALDLSASGAVDTLNPYRVL